ncbi:MAG: PAS domain-containing protein [Candidatus Omnitrophota bacterium]
MFDNHQSFLKEVIEAIPYPFFVIDIKNYTIEIANSISKQLGFRGDMKCYQLVHKTSQPCEAPQHICPIKEIIKTKKPVVVEHVHYDSQNNPVNIEIHAFPIFDDKGNVVQMIESCIDITSRKKLEQELVNKIKRLEKFNKSAVGRELRMIELKKKIRELEQEIIKK